MKRSSTLQRCLAEIVIVLALFTSACSGKVSGVSAGGPTGGQTTGSDGGSVSSGSAGTNGTTGAGSTAGSTGTTTGTIGTTSTGTTGSATDEPPCSGASDPRMVVAPQRILRLTIQEMLNTIRSLVDATEANNILTGGKYGNIGVETDMAFPPLDANREGVQIDDAKFQTLDAMAQDVAQYVSDHFVTLTSCPAPTTDDCATSYLNKLAEKAYRRPLDGDEQGTLTALYTKLRNGTDDGNGNTVTFTTQEAAQLTVYAILSTPELLYRSEIGDTSKMSSAPSGVPLTEYELATELAFFLTDNPPDATLLGEAAAGTLAADLPTQVDRLLAPQAAKDWLRLVMYTFYGINFLTNTQIDSTKFPVFNEQLLLDERNEALKFLDNVLWKGNLVDVLTTRTTFLNSNLATTIYGVPVPAGATETIFIQTTLPADQRIGLLTSAPFLMTASRTDRASIVPRGKLIRRTMTCVPTPAPPDDVAATVAMASMLLATQTAQQEAAFRAAHPECVACHSSMDPFGLVLDDYDDIGRMRTVNEIGMPVDTHATLPPELGGKTLQNVFDLAQTFAASPVFTNCMAQTVLQYALTDIYSAPVPLPSLPNTSPFVGGCATADVAARFNGGATKTFSDVVRAVASSPAFAIRVPAL